MEGFDTIFAEVRDEHGFVAFREVCECDFDESAWIDFLGGRCVAFTEFHVDPWEANGGREVRLFAERADDPLDRVECLVPWHDAEIELAVAAWREEASA